MSKINI